ncbi:early activation antigen CD69 isoform X2 [Etheostoma spectabile]|uniref:early activation antigen CD69 isoform X2 n=1 Tax=Etheostoma spectabile TaxID=54343 RepID=UPI0013AF6EEC|nr:early activation antigen CD69-like isoform X2 [Etheostoma spectabile]
MKRAMEMQEIVKEGERNEEDAGASEPMLEVKTEEEAEPDHYAKLQSPSEDVYSEALFGGAPVKTQAGKQTEGNTRLYFAACLFLTIICLVLLLVVIVLSVKLQTGSTVCPEREETTGGDRQSPLFVPTCSHKECQALLPNIQPQYGGCQQCADGWLTLGRSCFFLSTFRLSWEESQNVCISKGGALAVVTSQRVQSFLTKQGKLQYWIGLRHKGATWTWVNNTVLRESFWADNRSEGDCGILSSESPPQKNWIKASCKDYTYFICQVQL